jgi:hypothetical protein
MANATVAIVLGSIPAPTDTVHFERGIFWISYFMYVVQHCLCRKMLGSNPGQLRLRHIQTDALTTRLDLIHTRLELIQQYFKGGR